jgi:hypothetical protein
MRVFIAICLMPLICWSSFGQYAEVGGGFGVAHYRGDIPTQHMGLTQYSPAGSVFWRYNYNPWISVRVAFAGGSFSAFDPVPTMNGSSYTSRNLSFRSDFIEMGVQYEWNITGLDIHTGKRLSPYLFVGINGFYYNPTTNLQGERIALQPLGTEGQVLKSEGKGYNLLQLGIPIGLGFKYTLTPRTHIGLELGLRKTFSDYLDDVSGAYPEMEAMMNMNPLAARLSDRSPEVEGGIPMDTKDKMRGNPKNMDAYFVHQFTVSIVLGKLVNTEFDPNFKIFY